MPLGRREQERGPVLSFTQRLASFTLRFRHSNRSVVAEEPGTATESIRALAVVGAAAATAIGSAFAARAAHRHADPAPPVLTSAVEDGDVVIRDEQLVRIVEESIRTLQDAMKEERDRSRRLEDEIKEERLRARRLESELLDLRQEMRGKNLRIEELERGQSRLRNELAQTRVDLASVTGKTSGTRELTAGD